MDRRKKVLRYVPGHTLSHTNHGIKRVLLQVFGMAGHGKSALINSCLCVVRDRNYQDLARSGPDYKEVTTSREEYELTPQLLMVDNRGLNKLNEAEELETSAQFRQLRSMGPVSWDEKNLSADIWNFRQQITFQQHDFLVPVFVYSCYRSWNSMDGEEMRKIMHNVHKITGMAPIVVLTHSSSGDSEKIKEKFKAFGCTRFVSLENYTQTNQRRTQETDRKILELLVMCIEEAELGIERWANQKSSNRLIVSMNEQAERHLQQLRETSAKFYQLKPQ